MNEVHTMIIYLAKIVTTHLYSSQVFILLLSFPFTLDTKNQSPVQTLDFGELNVKSNSMV